MAENDRVQRAYTTLDVFTSEPFKGNPLAVVWEADGLTDQQMQQIAAEFGYSETTFVCSAAQKGVDASLRIFTPTFEIPFAGHPTIGTAIAFADKFKTDISRPLMFEETAGLVRVEVRDETGGRFAQFAPPVAPHILSDVVRDVSNIIGRTENVQVRNASAGTVFSFVELERLQDVDACAGGSDLLELTVELESVGLFVYARTADHRIYARMFAPEVGVPEDPATGSAVAALAAILSADGWPLGEYEVKQGVKMGRESDLYLTLGQQDEVKGIAARVGGQACTMMQGWIRI